MAYAVMAKRDLIAGERTDEVSRHPTNEAAQAEADRLSTESYTHMAGEHTRPVFSVVEISEPKPAAAPKPAAVAKPVAVAVAVPKPAADK